MQLEVYERKGKSKGELTQIRNKGDIPAVLYSKGKEGTIFSVKGDAFQALLRTTQKGRLSTQILTLVEEGKKEKKAILKDIQYHVVTYAVQHLDFEEIVDDSPITVNIPIECTGAVDCIGIKLGGVLRQVIRQLKVRCLPSQIPEVFAFDVRNMKIADTKRLKELSIPEGVRPLADLKEVAVVIAKR